MRNTPTRLNTFGYQEPQIDPATVAAMIAATPARALKPHPRRGSRARVPEHVERRRRWANRGKLPDVVACQCTLGEKAVLGVVAAEVQGRGDCRMTNKQIADLAGVSVSQARNTLRRAKALKFISITERRVKRDFSLPNIVRIILPEWRDHLRLSYGVSFVRPTKTRTKEERKRPAEQDAQRAVNERTTGQRCRSFKPSNHSEAERGAYIQTV